MANGGQLLGFFANCVNNGTLLLKTKIDSCESSYNEEAISGSDDEDDILEEGSPIMILKKESIKKPELPSRSLSDLPQGSEFDESEVS